MHIPTPSANQTFVTLTSAGLCERQLPPATAPVGSGPLTWGRCEEIGSPAYWCSQAWTWEMEEPSHFRLGVTLEDEVLACILGGYGIPAEVGMAAYERLRRVMREAPETMRDADTLFRLLSEPLDVGGRRMRYRFPGQKSSRVAAAMRRLADIDRGTPDRDLRTALAGLPGIGLKTASWIVRNWRGSDEVSILDVHIVRAGRALGIFRDGWEASRHYLRMEAAYLGFAGDIGARASILDSVMWMTMRQLSAMAARPRSASAQADSRQRRFRGMDV